MRSTMMIRIGGAILSFLMLNAVISCSAVRPFKDKTNVIIILTDDMDNKLLPFVENTNTLIGGQGATFTNYFVSTSICCPSRASMIRGQYAHNTAILANGPPNGGFRRFFLDGEEPQTLAVWLSNAGYKTALFGKYLNGYPDPAGRNYVPPGWSDWHTFIFQKPGEDEEGSFYFNYTMNENGKLVQYGNTPQDYSTDVIKQRAITFINQNAKEGTPFFALVAVYGPHGPSIPAPRHADMLPDLKYPEGPSYNESDVSDKPKIISSLPLLGDWDFTHNNDLYRRRAQTMLSVDELVKEVIQQLQQNGQLDNTYIIFTSDNGFHIGEHRLPSGKGTPYEEDIRVPFMIRGPGIQPNSTVTQIVSNIDIAPTIAEFTGGHPSNFVDGRSFIPLLQPQTRKPVEWRQGLNIEIGNMEASSSSLPQVSFVNSTPPILYEYPDSIYDPLLAQVGGGAYRGVRTENFLYVEYKDGETEYYDLKNDPYELNNIASTLAPDVLSSLHSWLDQLKTCKVADCRKFETSMPDNLNK